MGCGGLFIFTTTGLLYMEAQLSVCPCVLYKLCLWLRVALLQCVYEKQNVSEPCMNNIYTGITETEFLNFPGYILL